MSKVLLIVFSTLVIMFGIVESYKLLPLLINDKFRGTFDLVFDETKTKSNLYAPHRLEIRKVAKDKIELVWNFEKKEFLPPAGEAPELGILSGYRIYKDGYWHKDVSTSDKKFIDEDLYPDENYSYSVSALTFDNKIEGLKSESVTYKTDNFAKTVVEFPIPKPKRYLAEGDSITIAENVQKGAGWAEIVSNHFNLEIRNKAVSGSTSFSVDDRIDDEIKEFDPDLVTIAVGVNDIFGASREIGNVSMSDYHDNLKSIVEKVNKDKKRNVVLLNIFYINCCSEKHKAWDKEVKGLANALGVLYVDVSSQMIKNGGKSLLEGDLHPNSEGHKIISEAVIGELSKYMK